MRSADLEMTVNTLIQIDKLVQLLESPVFTCKTSATMTHITF
jgi:vacuole morphology and inheritance protein 14